MYIYIYMCAFVIVCILYMRAWKKWYTPLLWQIWWDKNYEPAWQFIFGYSIFRQQQHIINIV